MIAHYAQVWHDSCERIVGYLGTSCADGAQEGGFSSVWKSHQSNVGKYFELYDYPSLYSRLAWLSIARCLICCGFEMVVAQASTSTTGNDEGLSIFSYFAKYFASFGVAAHAPQRHIEHLVLTFSTCAEVFASVLAIFGKHVFCIF